jgi:hypothetical protein
VLLEKLLFLLLSKVQRGSKLGILFLVMGIFVFFVILVFGVASFVGVVSDLLGWAGPITDFLETGERILEALFIAVICTLLGAGFLVYMSRPDSALGDAEVSFRSEGELQAELRQSERERERVERERDALKA